MNTEQAKVYNKVTNTYRTVIGPIFLLLVSIGGYSQSVSCEELGDFIYENGYKKSTIPSYILNSTWLNEVTAYEYDYKIYVFAEIKKNEFSYQTNTYIFCDIPSINWTNFKFGSYGDTQSYGERFHKYIRDYECNCD